MTTPTTPPSPVHSLAWLRDGALVYTLIPCKWRGKDAMQNGYEFRVTSHISISDADCEAVAKDIYGKITSHDAMRRALEEMNKPGQDADWYRSKIREALAALEAKADAGGGSQ